jgi:hypothetical protein
VLKLRHFLESDDATPPTNGRNRECQENWGYILFIGPNFARRDCLAFIPIPAVLVVRDGSECLRDGKVEVACRIARCG